MDNIRQFSRKVDFGRVAELYAQHLAGYPDEVISRLTDQGVGSPDQTILDVGTGPGTLARKFAKNASVTGIDCSQPMLSVASRLALEHKLSISFLLRAAENTGFEDGTFDAVTAGQAWHLFDRPVAATEMFRVLKPGGLLAITHYEWISLPGNAAETTESVVRCFSPDFALGGHGAIYPQWSPDLLSCGFQDISTFSFEEGRRFSHEQWCSRIQSSAAGLASLDVITATALDARLAQTLRDHFPPALDIPHRSWSLVARKPLQAPN